MSTQPFTLYLERGSPLGNHNLATRSIIALKELRGQAPEETLIPEGTQGTFIRISDEFTSDSAAMMIFCDFGGAIYSARSELSAPEIRRPGACFSFEEISIV